MATTWTNARIRLSHALVRSRSGPEVAIPWTSLSDQLLLFFTPSELRLDNPDLPRTLRFGPAVGRTLELVRARSVRLALESGRFAFFWRTRPPFTPTTAARTIFLSIMIGTGMLYVGLLRGAPSAAPEGLQEYQHASDTLKPLLGWIAIGGGIVVPMLLLVVDCLLPHRSRMLAARLTPDGAEYFHDDGRISHESWDAIRTLMSKERNTKPSPWAQRLQLAPKHGFQFGVVQAWVRSQIGSHARRPRSHVICMWRAFWVLGAVAGALFAALGASGVLRPRDSVQTGEPSSGEAGVVFGLVAIAAPLLLTITELGTHRPGLRLRQVLGLAGRAPYVTQSRLRRPDSLQRR